MTEEAAGSVRSIDLAVARMTLEEKASLTLGSSHWSTAPIERLGIQQVRLSDGPHGLRTQLAGADHVGFSASVPATCFPTSAALASSWNPALFADVGRALAREARRWSVGVVLGPGVNMKRSPLCGRNFEYLSEDPWLAGELATAMVEGIQALGVGACIKHFAANNQETDRLRVSADVDERTLREIYLPAFERLVKEAKPWMVMCSYNKINGIYASEHAWLLTDVLRGEWGFEGVVVSDWGAVDDRVAALAAGLDLEMPPDLGRSDVQVIAAVKNGVVAEGVLDETSRRLVRLASLAAPARSAPIEYDDAAHHSIARRAAQESAILLKNDAVLPLRLSAGQSIAVIGEFARTPRFQGAGSSRVNATRVDIALEELTAVLPDEVSLKFAPGFGLDSDAIDAGLIDEAATVARQADHVVLFLGLPGGAESEGFDRTHMDLPANQLALLDAVAGVTANTIVVLTNGSSVLVSPWEGRVAAILECWLAGQAAGGAVADLLLGIATPSGKLAETIPVRLEDVPSTLNFPGDSGHVRYGEGLFIGYRAHDQLLQAVSYPFGFGLSYTTFSVTDVDVTLAGSVHAGDFACVVSASVTNTGGVRGAEVVQVYVGDPESTVSRPPRELKAATKVELEPGQSRRVEMRLDQRAFAFWSDRHHRWAVEEGDFTISVGTSSRDFVASVPVFVAAPSLARPITEDSSLEEWLADDTARSIINAVFDGRPQKPLFLDPAVLKVISNMPMRRIAASDSSGLAHDELDAMLVDIERSNMPRVAGVQRQ